MSYFESRSGKYKAKRDYAIGGINVSKYRELLKLNNGNSFVKVDWNIKRGYFKRFITKFWSRHPIKSYRVVNRLMNRIR